MKPTKNEIVAAVGQMGLLRYFPAGEHERIALMRILESMVGTKAQLDWLVGVLLNNVGDWPGPKELRGIFCTRYKPADGIEGDASIAGFTADDGERKFLQQSTQALSGGQKLIAGDVSPAEITASEDAKARIFALAVDGVKSIPKPRPVTMTRRAKGAS